VDASPGVKVVQVGASSFHKREILTSFFESRIGALFRIERSSRIFGADKKCKRDRRSSEHGSRKRACRGPETIPKPMGRVARVFFFRHFKKLPEKD
jgi:hypothetical protein